MEGFYVEINLQKKKWLLCCFCNPNKNAIKSHIEILHKGLALYSSKYENFIILGDFSVGMDNSDMTVFCDMYDPKCLIKEPTCHKNPENPSCIDLILTNNPKCFQSSCVVETGLSDFHRMTVTVMKATFKKFEPRIIHYRDYKNFQNDQYRDELTPKLSNIVSENNNIRLNEFLSICMDTLDRYAPCKQKYTRGNHLPFMNKTISKEIMKRTRFRNQFLKNRTDENKSRYTKQRNYCVSLLRKTKTQYYSNLDEKNVTDNKAFWKTVKPFLSDKITSKEKITLIEENEIVSNDENTAQVLNTFFSNIVIALISLSISPTTLFLIILVIPLLN